MAFRVLIVEDLPSDVELAQRVLKTVLEDLEFSVVDNKSDYVDALKVFKPDLAQCGCH